MVHERSQPCPVSPWLARPWLLSFLPSFSFSLLSLSPALFFPLYKCVLSIMCTFLTLSCSAQCHGGGSFRAFWEVNLRKKDVFLYPSKSINIHSSSNIRGTTYLRLFLSFRKPDVYILSFWHRRQWLEADRPRLNGNGAKGHGVTELKPGQDCA